MPVFGMFGVRNFCSAPDDGGGTGGGTATEEDIDTDEGGDDSGKKYTDEDVERMITQRVKRSARDVATKEKELAAKEKRIAELEEKLQELSDKIDAAGDGGTGANDEDLRKQQGHWELQKTRYDSQIKELREKLEVAERDAAKSNKDRLNLQRDLEIDKALGAIQCIDIDNGRILVRERVRYDDAEGEWYFETRSGNMVTVKEGVDAELPDYLRPASMRQGGSGSTGGSPKSAAQRRKLDDMKAEYDKIVEAVKRNPRNTDTLVRASKLRKEIAALDKQLSKSS